MSFKKTNKNIVLIAIGEKPQYISDCLLQIRKWFRGGIHLVLENQSNLNRFEYRLLGIKHSIKITNVRRFPKPATERYEQATFLSKYGNFWNYSMRRLFILEDYIKYKKLENIIHIENDVMIYHDINQLELDDQKVFINKVSENLGTWAFVFIKDYESLNKVNNRQIEILNMGNEKLRKLYKNDLINEMLIAGQLLNEGIVDTLPMLPIDNICHIYDGSAYGQWVGGNGIEGPGFAESDRIVGKQFIDNKIELKWCVDHQGKKYPMCTSKVSEASSKIINLHIHSKNLKEFSS